MKTRIDFVSNSSSSNFILGVPKERISPDGKLIIKLDDGCTTIIDNLSDWKTFILVKIIEGDSSYIFEGDDCLKAKNIVAKESEDEFLKQVRGLEERYEDQIEESIIIYHNGQEILENGKSIFIACYPQDCYPEWKTLLRDEQFEEIDEWGDGIDS